MNTIKKWAVALLKTDMSNNAGVLERDENMRMTGGVCTNSADGYTVIHQVHPLTLHVPFFQLTRKCAPTIPEAS
jgi:hypothetical protein